MYISGFAFVVIALAFAWAFSGYRERIKDEVRGELEDELEGDAKDENLSGLDDEGNIISQYDEDDPDDDEDDEVIAKAKKKT